jgi:hypothetical protein
METEMESKLEAAALYGEMNGVESVAIETKALRQPPDIEGELIKQGWVKP